MSINQVALSGQGEHLFAVMIFKPMSMLTQPLSCSRRYMSPEVVKILPYGLSTDVYSFAICFHEVLSLSPAFDNYTREQHYKEVVSEGKRPKLPKSWPEMIKDLFHRSWHDDASKRPSMEAVRQLIRNALPEDHKIDERANDLMLRSSRSTSAHGFNPLDLSVN